MSSVNGADSVHLDLVLAADEEIDRQLENTPNGQSWEIVEWIKSVCACPRGAFEARALQRGFVFQRQRMTPDAMFRTVFIRQYDHD